MLNSTPWEALFPLTIDYKLSENFLLIRQKISPLLACFIPDLNNSANLNSEVFQSYREH